MGKLSLKDTTPSLCSGVRFERHKTSKYRTTRKNNKHLATIKNNIRKSIRFSLLGSSQVKNGEGVLGGGNRKGVRFSPHSLEIFIRVSNDLTASATLICAK